MPRFREDPGLRDLHIALLEIAGEINRPNRDEWLLFDSGISLERALFPLLILVQRFGPIGVVDLAGRAGRDYTTVSRQVARLAAFGLVERRVESTDGRQHLTSITSRGRSLGARVSRAREGLAASIFASWSPRDVREFTRLARRFANSIRGGRASDRRPRPVSVPTDSRGAPESRRRVEVSRARARSVKSVRHPLLQPVSELRTRSR